MNDVRSIALGDNTVHLVQRGPERLLVDTGPDYAGAWEALQRELAGRAPYVVVATHGHHDHAGLGRRWQEAGVPVLMGEADAPLSARPLMESSAEAGALLAWAEGTGAPPETLAQVHERLAARRDAARLAAESKVYSEGSDRWPTGLRYPPFEASGFVEGDARVAGMELLAAPGHTPGNLVLAVPDEGWLFSGDQLLPGIDPLPAIQFVAEGDGLARFRSLPRFVSSMRRLAEGGYERCFPGHGEPFDDVQGAIAAVLARVERRSERTLGALRTQGPASVYELCKRLYPRTTKRRFWQTASSTQGQLDLLEERGQAVEHAGVWEAQ